MTDAARPLPADAPDERAADSRPTFKAWWTLFLLCLLYMLSLLDRVTLTLLVVPLKARFGVGDVEIGLLYGTSFALFFCASGVFLARVADRGGRRRLLVTGVLLWSFSTLLAPFAPNFYVLLLLRCGLSIGEAALSPVAYSLIGDLFARSRRSLAASMFLASGSMSAFLAYIVGGFTLRLAAQPIWRGVPFITALANWQRVFLIVGLPPVVAAILFLITVKEPPRTATAPDRLKPVAADNVIAELRYRWRLYLALMVGCASPSMISQTLNAWLPEIMRRTLHWPIDQAAIWSGLVGTLAVAIGITSVPMVGEAVRRSGPISAPLQVAAGSALLGFACAAGAMLVSQGVAMLLLLLPALVFMSGCVSIGFNCVLEVAPSQLRATMMSITLISATLMGIGTGPALSAWIAQYLLHDPARLNTGIALMILVVAPITLLLLISGIGPFAKTHARIACRTDP